MIIYFNIGINLYFGNNVGDRKITKRNFNYVTE